MFKSKVACQDYRKAGSWRDWLVLVIPWIVALQGILSIWKRIDNPLHADAEHVYLPAAQAFLEHGLSFFWMPQSYRVVPLAYLWPALWGADPETIRVANMALWIGCVIFLWKTARLLGGSKAGVIALLLWGIHPELPRYFATELTEPIFLFGIFGWLYAMACIFVAKNTSFTKILLAAVMLAITLLSRPVLQLMAPGLLVLGVAYLGFSRFFAGAAKNEAATCMAARVRAVCWALLLGLLVPAMLVVKNGVVFGLWGMGTGSGAGLYLGTHPLFQGAEPPFLGFNYDINILAREYTGDGDHLSLSGDRAARAAAMWHLQSMGGLGALAFLAQKMWWWLLHHPAQLLVFGSELRQLRILELLVLLMGMFGMANSLLQGWRSRPLVGNGGEQPRLHKREQLFVAWVFLIFLGMLAQLLPILYNTRYSSALLDPWLIVMVAFFAASFLERIRLGVRWEQQELTLSLGSAPGFSLRAAVFPLVAVLLGTPVFYNLAKKLDDVSIKPSQMGPVENVVEWAGSVQAQGMKALPDGRWEIGEAPAVLHLELTAEDVQKVQARRIFNALWEVELSVDARKSCDKVEAAYRTSSGRILQPQYNLPLNLSVQTDGRPQHIAVHANREMRPQEAGSLRLIFHCPVGAEVKVFGARLLESRHPWEAARQITIE